MVELPPTNLMRLAAVKTRAETALAEAIAAFEKERARVDEGLRAWADQVLGECQSPDARGEAEAAIAFILRDIPGLVTTLQRMGVV